MTLMLELSSDTEARLRRKAERAGQSLPEYLIAVADAEPEEAEEDDSEEAEEDDSEGSAYDLFKGRIGLFRSGGDGTWSQDTGRKFAEGMAEKRRQGRL